jgi:hypothetical protein
VGARAISVIGVPLDLGAGRRGVDMGPSAFRQADIHETLRELGYDVQDAGDVPVSIRETQDPGDPHRKYLREIRDTCERLRDRVVQDLGAGRLPVVLGGDHSIAMGTIAGVSKFHRGREQKIGLIWFDAHGDMNTPETSPSGNIHGMPLAAALGIGDPSLVGLAGAVPMVEGARAAVVGLRDVDPAEHHRQLSAGELLNHPVPQPLADLADLSQVLAARVAGILGLADRHRHVARVLYVVAELAQRFVDLGLTERGGTHVHATPARAEVQGNADHADAASAHDVMLWAPPASRQGDRASLV